MIRLIAIWMCLVLSALPAAANQVTVHFYGALEAVNGGLKPGTPFHGVVTYPTDATRKAQPKGLVHFQVDEPMEVDLGCDHYSHKLMYAALADDQNVLQFFSNDVNTNLTLSAMTFAGTDRLPGVSGYANATAEFNILTPAGSGHGSAFFRVTETTGPAPVPPDGPCAAAPASRAKGKPRRRR